MSGRRSHGADTDGKMAEIREWVEGLGGPTSPAVPALSDASLAYLQRLSTASKARDGLNRRLAAEARRQGASQEAEATRAVAILERCSLHFDRWDPRSGDMKRVVQGQSFWPGGWASGAELVSAGSRTRWEAAWRLWRIQQSRSTPRTPA